MTSRKRKAKGYIHGYDRAEQLRLIEQAKYLEPYVYPGIDFRGAKTILEIGCGVGAQTKILLKRFPRLKIDAVDVSHDQLRQAERYLRREISEGRVRLIRSDAGDLRSALGSNRYDGAYICWFLEHVAEPERVLKSARRFLKPGARVFLTEVFNQTFFADPFPETLSTYWDLFIGQQARLGGDPNIGPKLAAMLQRAGFREVESQLRSLHFDSRDNKAKRRFLDYFEELILSAAPALTSDQKITAGDVRRLKSEFRGLRSDSVSMIHLGFVRAQGRVE